MYMQAKKASVEEQTCVPCVELTCDTDAHSTERSEKSD